MPRSQAKGDSTGPEAAPAVLRTRIGYVDGEAGVLEYRGYRIEDLARDCSFEEVVHLLLVSRLPTRPELEGLRAELARHRSLKFRIVDMLKCLPDGGRPMHALTAAVSALAMFYPGPSQDHLDPLPHAQRLEACIRLIAKLPAIVAAWHRMRRGDMPLKPRDDLDHAANFLYMLDGAEPDREMARVLEVCLILHAEHGLAPSTWAARIAGASLADPYSVVAAALGTLAGPLHGGANEHVLSMLGEIGTPDRVESWVEERLRSRRHVWAFGHRDYRVKDPRATLLQEQNEVLFRKFGRTVLYDVAVGLEQHLLDHPEFGAAPTPRDRKFPNVDFYSGIAYDKMGIPSDLFTAMFALARVAGWLAHYLEQVESAGDPSVRPPALYEGPRGLEFLPIDARA